MPGEWEMVGRLVLASIFGGLIGLEREVHGREAGVRTYLLVSLGSALIMVVSQFLGMQFDGKFSGETLRVDPGRIAAQAITGIGFLGAGVILRYRDWIRGLTTAAGMWVACALGLAIGSGYYLYGTVTTGITLVSLLGVKKFEKKLSKDWYRELIVVSDDREGQTERIEAIINQSQMKVIGFYWRKDLPAREITLNFRLRFRAIQPHPRLLQEVIQLEGIKTVEVK